MNGIFSGHVFLSNKNHKFMNKCKIGKKLIISGTQLSLQEKTDLQKTFQIWNKNLVIAILILCPKLTTFQKN